MTRAAHEDAGEWHSWYAWHPVRLHREFRFAWLRRVSRRMVADRAQYTDLPGNFPKGFGLKR